MSQFPRGAILDEIQRVPELTSYIQPLVDERQENGLFVLTGSQNFNVINTVSQSLAGRTGLFTLLPLQLSELQQAKKSLDDIDLLLYSGFYPRIYQQNLPPTIIYADYCNTYIERAIRQLAQVNNLLVFQNFMRLCAGRTGSLLNIESLSRDVGISQITVKHWLSLLQASYILFLLPPFYENIRKRIVKHPKIYFYDVGLACYLNGITTPQQIKTHPLRGHLFETLVVGEIMKIIANYNKHLPIYFCRDSNDNEIDILITIGGNHIHIEIKSAQTLVSDFFKGFKVFKDTFSNAKVYNILVFGGVEEQRREENTWVCPVQKLEKKLLEIIAEIES